MPNPLNIIVPTVDLGNLLGGIPGTVTIEDPYKKKEGDYPNGEFPNANSEYKATPVDNKAKFLISADKKDIIPVPGTYGVVQKPDGEYHADLQDVVYASLNPNMSLNRVKRLAKLDAMNGAVGPRLNIDDPNVVNEPNNWDYEYSMFRKAYEDDVKARFIKKFIKWNEKDPVGAANAFEYMQRNGKIPSHWRLPAGSRQEKVYNNLREYYTGPQYRLYDKSFADLMLKFAKAVPQMAGLLMGVSGTVGKGWGLPASRTAPAFNPTIVNNVARFGQASVPISRQIAQVAAGTLGALATNEAVKGLSKGKYNSTGELVTNPDDPWYVKLMADIATNPFSYPSAVYKNIANTAWNGGKATAKYIGNFLNNLSKKVQPIDYVSWRPSTSGTLGVGLTVPTGLRNYIFKPKNRIVPTGNIENPGEFARTVFNDESLPIDNWVKYKVFENGDEVGTRLMKEDVTGKYIIDNLNDSGVARIQYAGSKGSWDNPKYVVKYIDESGIPQITLIDDFDDAAAAAGKFYNKDPRSGGAILGTYDDKAMKWNPLPEEETPRLTPNNKAEGTNTSSSSNSDENYEGFWDSFMWGLNDKPKNVNTGKWAKFKSNAGRKAGKFVRKFPKRYGWGYELPSAILNTFGISPAQLRFKDTYEQSDDAGRDQLSREGIFPLSGLGWLIEWLFPYANRYKNKVGGSKQGNVPVNEQSSSSSETGKDNFTEAGGKV